MDPVQIAMLGVGAALAALIVTLTESLRRHMHRRFDGFEKRVHARLGGELHPRSHREGDRGGNGQVREVANRPLGP